jgi:hypothetical protein
VLGDITPHNTFYDSQLDVYRLGSSGKAHPVRNTTQSLQAGTQRSTSTSTGSTSPQSTGE